MNILDFLSLIDWVTPIFKEAEDIAHGGPVNLKAWTFFIPHDESVRRGWSQDHIEDLLKTNGVKFWSSWVNFGEYSFSVMRSDAGHVERMLKELNIPIHPRSQGA